MFGRSAFDLDCNRIIPECECKCGKCLQEMRSIFEAMQGVTRLYTEGSGKDTRIIVEHDSCTVTLRELMETFGRLPSFHKGSFVPRLLQA